jgi:hypothetical protein
VAKVLPILAKSDQVLPNTALGDFGEDSKLFGPVLHMWGLRRAVYVRCQERIVGLVAIECCRRPSHCHSSVASFADYYHPSRSVPPNYFAVSLTGEPYGGKKGYYHAPKN